MENNVMLESGKQLKFTSMSAREIILRFHMLSTVKEERDESGNITKLNIDGYNVSLDEILYLRLFDKYVRPFKTLFIRKSKQGNAYVLNSTIPTKASRFIMPMLRMKDETQTTFKYGSHFINCYVGTSDEGYMDNIYLVYRYSGTPEYAKFEEYLRNHELFEEQIDLDHQQVMYRFSMTSEDKNNYEKFKSGQYSKFSEDYKKKILSFIINPAIIREEDVHKTITY